MIKNEINQFIEKLLKKTENNELNWMPAQEFFDNVSPSSSAASELNIMTHFEYANFYHKDSFYLSNNEQFLFLLHFDLESGKDGSITEIWGLYAILDLDDNMFESIPDYHPSSSEDRIKKISDIIKKNIAADEAKKEKRLLAFFDSII